MRVLVLVASALLAGCGAAEDPTIEPVSRDGGASSNELLNEAAGAAGNAQARMSAEAGSELPSNLQAEKRQ